MGGKRSDYGLCQAVVCKIEPDRRLGLPIVNRGEGLEAGGVAKLCYCSLSRDKCIKIYLVIGDCITEEAVVLEKRLL